MLIEIMSKFISRKKFLILLIFITSNIIIITMIEQTIITLIGIKNISIEINKIFIILD